MVDTMTGRTSRQMRRRSTGGSRSSLLGSLEKGQQTLTWNEIESWQQDNHFIIRGYRAATNSYRQSVQSLAYVHNQTVNIWSHLLGAMAFITSAAYLYHHQYYYNHGHEARGQVPQFDLLLFGQFYGGLLACLALSAMFHTFGNHSDVIRHCFLLGDLAGIILLTMSSFYPGVYYGFYCEPQIARVYWTMVSQPSSSSSPHVRKKPVYIFHVVFEHFSPRLLPLPLFFNPVRV